MDAPNALHFVSKASYRMLFTTMESISIYVVIDAMNYTYHLLKIYAER